MCGKSSRSGDVRQKHELPYLVKQFTREFGREHAQGGGFVKVELSSVNFVLTLALNESVGTVSEASCGLGDGLTAEWSRALRGTSAESSSG